MKSIIATLPLARIWILFVIILGFALPVQATVNPEQVEPERKVAAPQLQSQEPTKKVVETVALRTPAPIHRGEFPLQEMWEGVLDFLYGTTESDSTKTR